MIYFAKIQEYRIGKKDPKGLESSFDIMVNCRFQKFKFQLVKWVKIIKWFILQKLKNIELERKVVDNNK